MNITKNKKIIDKILTAHELALHGYCDFDMLKDKLITCRASLRLFDAFSPDLPKTIICVLFPYCFDKLQGNLSQYARVPDYHSSAGAVLENAAKDLKSALPKYNFLSFIDNSPIPEVLAAALSGLGCVGDNGLLINPIYGSWVFIGTIVTNIPFDMPPVSIAKCTQCGACSTACPGGCIGKSRDTCVSRISQNKGELSQDQIALLQKSGMAWGCDRCQHICPLNANALINPHPCFGDKPFNPDLTDESLNDLKGKAYGWRGVGVLKRNISFLGRNKGE